MSKNNYIAEEVLIERAENLVKTIEEIAKNQPVKYGLIYCYNF